MNPDMSIDEKLRLIHEVGEEINTDEDLVSLLNQAESSKSSNERPIAYDGFEPSGQMHIAQGILRTININKMIHAGFTFKMYIADWHAYLNNKLGGDLEKIQTTGKYFIEIWKACGMDLDHVEFVWASDLVKKKAIGILSCESPLKRASNVYCVQLKLWAAVRQMTSVLLKFCIHSCKQLIFLC